MLDSSWLGHSSNVISIWNEIAVMTVIQPKIREILVLLHNPSQTQYKRGFSHPFDHCNVVMLDTMYVFSSFCEINLKFKSCLISLLFIYFMIDEIFVLIKYEYFCHKYTITVSNN